SDKNRITDLRSSVRDMEGIQNGFSHHIQSMSSSDREKEAEELRSRIEVWEKVQGQTNKSGNKHRELSNKVRSKMRESEGAKDDGQATPPLVATNRAIQEALKTGSPQTVPFKAGIEAWKQATGAVAANAKNLSGGKVALTFIKGSIKTAQHAAYRISNPTGGSAKIMKSILQSATRKMSDISREASRGR